jgi:hypothetical protein
LNAADGFERFLVDHRQYGRCAAHGHVVFVALGNMRVAARQLALLLDGDAVGPQHGQFVAAEGQHRAVGQSGRPVESFGGDLELVAIDGPRNPSRQ